MIDCPRTDVRDRLPEWVHGRLGASDAAVIADHVRACAPCTGEVALLRDLRSALSVEPRVDVARIVAAVAQATPPARRLEAQRPGHGARWRRYVGVAALAAGIAAVFLWPGRTSEVPVATAPVGSAPASRGNPEGGGSVTDGRTVSLPVGGAARGVAPPSAAGPELVMEGGFAHLADSDLEALLSRLDAVDGVLATSPEPGFGVIPAGGTK